MLVQCLFQSAKGPRLLALIRGAICTALRAETVEPMTASGPSVSILRDLEVLTLSYRYKCCESSAFGAAFCLAAGLLYGGFRLLHCHASGWEEPGRLSRFRCAPVWMREHSQQGRGVNTSWFFIILFHTVCPPVFPALCRPVCWFRTRASETWDAQRGKISARGIFFFFGTDFFQSNPVTVSFNRFCWYKLNFKRSISMGILIFLYLDLITAWDDRTLLAIIIILSSFIFWF